jgi:phage/plasmid-like protein (TIGR03299 family)
MAHNINTYIGRQAAWHALGTVTGNYQTTEELLADPGFQYDVFKSQLHDGLGRAVDAYGTFRWNWKDKREGRKDAAQFLGAVGKDYTVIQHAEGFKSIDAVMRTARELRRGAHYETAGVLGNGERVWALADLGLAARVGEDVQTGYLLFSTGHDGSMAHSYRLCFTRVVCQNTLGAALSERTKAALTIRHTKNALGRLVDARAALDSMGDDVARVEDRLNFLAGRKCNREAMQTIFDRLFPKTRKDDDSEVSSTRRDNILADVLKIYELNDGNAFPEQRGSAYNLLNAITNYTDHERSSKEDGRAESAMFGSSDALKSKAMEVIYEVSNKSMDVMPSHTVYAAASRGSESIVEELLSTSR